MCCFRVQYCCLLQTRVLTSFLIKTIVFRIILISDIVFGLVYRATALIFAVRC